MNKRIKNLKIISSFVLSLLLLLMTGCKSKNMQKTGNNNNKQGQIELLQNSEYGYKTEYIDIGKKAGEVSSPVLSGNTLYFTNIVDTKEGATSGRLQSVDLSSPQEIKTYDSFSKGESYVQSLRFLHANNDGGVSFLQILLAKETENAEYENLEYDGTYHLIRLDADGAVISDLDVSRYFKYQIFLYGVYAIRNDAIRNDAASEFLYVYTQPMPGSEDMSEQENRAMLVINCETGEGEKTEIDCEPSALISLDSGDIAAIVYDSWTGKNTIRLWDKEKKHFSEQEIDFSDNTFYEIYPAYEDKFYYTDGVTLSLYDLSEQKTEQAMRLLDWNIPVTSLSLVSYVDSEHMMIVGNGGVYRLTRVKTSEIEPKTEILLGCLGIYGNTELITEFNIKHPDYQIVIKNYIPEDDEEIDYDEAVSLLTRDILSGNAPDLIDLSGVDYARYSGSGAFEDLYPYIQKDKEFQNRNLNQNILSLFQENGALYVLPSEYQIKALASGRQTLKEELFTLDNYLEMPKEAAEKKQFRRISRETLLSTLFAYNEDYLIDYKTKTCNFTDGVFEKILTIAKEHRHYENEDDVFNESGELPKLAGDGQLLFYPMNFYDIISEYQYVEKIFDNQFYITGYPSVEGDKIAVTITGNLYAISSQSEHKEVCWEFIKQGFDVSNEREKFQRLETLPVDNDALETYFEELKSESMGYFENGKPVPIGYMNDVAVYAPTEEEIQKIKELTRRVNTLIPDGYAGDIYKILSEEAESFYAGDKTAEETCRVIQSRVNLLINEN